MAETLGSSDERQLARRAGSVSLGVLLSRITGLVREQTLAFLFPTALLDGFVAAFTFPTTLRELLGDGALSKAFVATFARVDQAEGRDAAHVLLARVFRAVLPVALGITALAIAFAPELVDFVFTGAAFDRPLPEGLRFGFETPRDLTIWLMRVMFPFFVFAALAALYMGGLQARGTFFLPGAASALFNVTTVSCATLGAVLAPEFDLHPMTGLAIGVPLGGLVQMGSQLIWFRRRGYRPGPTGGFAASVRDDAFRRVCRLFLPAAGAAGSLQINVVISRHFASAGTSWLAWFYMAYRLAQLPIGLIAVALSNATLPALTRAAGRSDRAGFARVLSQSARLMLLLTLAAAAGLAGISDVLVSVIFRHGAFTSVDAEEVARILRLFALGLPAFGATRLLTDAFFALGSTRPPLLVALVGTGLTWLATRTFVVTAGLGHLGLPLATVTVAWASVGLLILLLTPKLSRGGPGAGPLGREILAAGLRAAPVAIATGGVAAALAAWIRGFAGPGALSALAATVGGVALGLAVFAATARLIAPAEWKLVSGAAREFGRKLRRAPGPEDGR